MPRVPPDPLDPPAARWRRLRIKWLDRTGWRPEDLEQLREHLGIDTDLLKQQLQIDAKYYDDRKAADRGEQ